MEALSAADHDRLGWITKMPQHGETVELGSRTSIVRRRHPLQ